MFEKLKALFNPKFLVAKAIDSLDSLVPLLAHEIENAKEKLASLSSKEQAQWLVDRVQAFLKAKFHIAE